MKLTGKVKLYGLHDLPVRPAQGRVRKSLFDILRGQVSGARVLDLFAGTGSLGVEALLQGAAKCVFVDVDRDCAAALRENLVRLRLDTRAEVIRLDALRAVPILSGRSERFDIAFIAPPYAMFDSARGFRDFHRLLELLIGVKVLESTATVVIEHRLGQLDMLDVPGLARADRHEYGQTHVTFLAPHGGT
ncbi:MAG: RsmD family RNA methyltransferase [Planctomycetota bacterium]|nr:RsmD family RNA methyltransferase [Planctomycetota bacterium]